MKNNIFLVAIALLISGNLLGQSIEITPFYGYTLNGTLRTYYGDYKVANKSNYGGLLSVSVADGNSLELMYNRSDTEFNYNQSGFTQATIDMSIEYYQVGAVKQVDVHEKIKPFGAFTIGATRFHAKEGHDWEGEGVTYLDDLWTFSATLGAGLKLYLTDRIGFRMQARLLMPMRFNGIYLGVGSGGTSGGASFYVPVVSGDFTAGLILRLGN